MENVEISENQILFTRKGELVRITPCGKNAIRFQSFPDCKIVDTDYSLMPQKAESNIEQHEKYVTMQCGSLKAELWRSGRITFYYNDKMILREKPELTFEDGYRNYKNIGTEQWKARITFEPNDNERFFGLGHRWDNDFDLKGTSVDIENVNAKCVIPYIYSSLGYGFMWNVPSIGSVELAKNRTRWSSDNCKAIDFVVIGGTPKDSASTLANLTGHAPMMPDFAMGFWQSRLRYETQEDLLRVARKYKELGVPLAVIVADYFHWTEQGEYKFEPSLWPDVKAMTDELHAMGTKLVVSIWPTINENSENYDKMLKENMLIRTKIGSNRVFDFYGPQAEIDATNPKTREFVWSKIKENYLDNGVDAVWFDEAEPEIHPVCFDNLIFDKGNGDAVALLYPYYYSKMAYDGQKSMGRNDIITLTRCAYFGSQKFGSLVWSGDIPSTFDSLSHQVKAALNMSMCGIPWWNTDIGGFYGGDTTSEDFRELIVRWFQFGLFCPVMRVHGNRERHGEKSNLKEPSGDGNEIWSFGEKNFPILKNLVMLRNKLKPYIKEQAKTASEKGYPIIRPMFFEYPDDEICYTLYSQYFFGSDIIFAPIVNKGQTEKTVYIPDGKWVLTKSGKVYTKGTYTISANIDEFVAFVKVGSDVIKCFDTH